MSGPSLLVLRKEWLPNLFEGSATGDCTFYNASIVPYNEGMTWNNKGEVTDKGVRAFRWDASFNIRWGNITVHLHSDHKDNELERFSKKLALLSQALKEFVEESKARVETPKENNTLHRREWLNDLTEETPYTGHLFYEIGPNGSGDFRVSDCHRSIIIRMSWDDFGPDKENNYGLKRMKKHWDYLSAIADHVDKALEGIVTLNTRHCNGELLALLPNDSEEIVVK